MATNISEKPYPIFDLSGGCQRKTTKFMGTQNQVDLPVNADFSRIGGVQKILGHERLGNTITTSSTTSTSTSTSTSTTSSTTSSTSSSTTTTAGA